MRSRRRIFDTQRAFALALATLFTAALCVSVAAPPLPDYLGGDEGPVATVRGADGRVVAAWAYHSGLEVDIALSVRISRTWTGPMLVGEGNGLVDQQPALGLLPDGSIYLAWVQGEPGGPGRIVGARLGPGGAGELHALSPAGVDASAPRLLETGSALVLAYVAGGQAAMRALGPRETGLEGQGSLAPEAASGSARLGPENPGLDPVSDPPTRGNAGGSNGPDPMPTRVPAEDPQGGSGGEEGSIRLKDGSTSR